MREPGGIVVLSLLLVSSGSSCRQSTTVEPQEGATVHRKTIERVQEEHTSTWMAIPGVVGTAIGQCEGKPCLFVLTASNTEQVRQQIPSTVEGYPVIVRFVGEIRALDEQ